MIFLAPKKSELLVKVAVLHKPLLLKKSIISHKPCMIILPLTFALQCFPKTLDLGNGGYPHCSLIATLPETPFHFLLAIPPLLNPCNLSPQTESSNA